ncbi:MAG: IS5 family transposase [Aestuariivita sp.]|nr:IS5 family transposase [Aestuariivita sp.]
MNKDRTVLTDAMWERMEPLLSGKATDPGRTADNRLFLEAVLWRFRTGSPWRDLPPRFGNWNSVFRRFRRWVQKGLFDRIFNVLSDEFDRSVVSIDGTIMQAHAKASGSEKGAFAKASGVQKHP